MQERSDRCGEYNSRESELPRITDQNKPNSVLNFKVPRLNIWQFILSTIFRQSFIITDDECRVVLSLLSFNLIETKFRLHKASHGNSAIRIKRREELRISFPAETKIIIIRFRLELIFVVLC